MKEEDRIARLKDLATAPRADGMRYLYPSAPGYFPTLRGRMVGGLRYETRGEAVEAARQFRIRCRDELKKMGIEWQEVMA